MLENEQPADFRSRHFPFLGKGFQMFVFRSGSDVVQITVCGNGRGVVKAKRDGAVEIMQR
jgi:hypothetical protein